MRGRNYDAVPEVLLVVAVVDKNGPRNRWRRSYSVTLLAYGLYSDSFQTSKGGAWAGPDSACVSLPMNNGPSISCARR